MKLNPLQHFERQLALPLTKPSSRGCLPSAAASSAATLTCRARNWATLGDVQLTPLHWCRAAASCPGPGQAGSAARPRAAARSARALTRHPQHRGARLSSECLDLRTM
jgi:hypothetical protein